MREGALGKFFTIILFTAICIGILGLMMNTVDENIQTYINNGCISFVDNARAKGSISVDALRSLYSTKSTAKDFTFEIHVEKKYYYPEMTPAGALTGATVLAYDHITQQDILDYMFNTSAGEQDYPLEVGDRIYITVTRTGPGFTAIAGLFGMGGRRGDIILANYSGTVYHSGN